MNEHIEKIKIEFAKQAENFNEYQKDFSKQDVTDFAIKNMRLTGTENVLEVAAGTCGFGRSVATFVRHITEFDITSAMLQVGKSEAEKQKIYNMSFVTGVAEELPFLENSFELVMSRLAFHHFIKPSDVFAQMAKVVKVNGKIVIIDMEAREEHLRDISDHFETLRDPSHTRCLSREDFIVLGKEQNFVLDFCETIFVPVKLDSWLELTKTPKLVRAEITQAMKADVNGGEKTGFEPYIKAGEIYFNHRWMLCVFQKGDHNE